MDLDSVWPRGSARDDVGDSKKLLEFIDKEILTLEFVQGIDSDVEPELARTIREYRDTRKQILAAIRMMKGV